MIAEYIKMEWDSKFKVGVSVNNVEFHARKTIIPYRSLVIAKNQELCKISGNLNKDSYDLSVQFSNNTNYTIKFWDQSSNIGTIKSVTSMIGNMISEKSTDALYDTMLPKIYDENNNQIGEIKYEAVKKEGLQSYHYYKLILNGITLKCYEVGHEKEIDFCIYNEQDQMIATISKRMPVKNGKSRYTMYMINESWNQYIVLLCTIMHHMNYDENDFQKLGIQSNKLNTFQTELKEKYNPEFKQHIIESVGADNIPENMPLVQESVKKSQNTFLIIYKKIISLLFIIFFIAMFVLFFFSRK